MMRISQAMGFPQRTGGMWAAAYLGVTALTLILSLFPASDPDLFIMLATGRQVVEEHRIPKAEEWSYTAKGQPWQMHEWLSSAGIYLAYKAGGVNAVILLKSLFLVGTMFLLLTVARLRGAGPAGALLASVTGLLIFQYGFAERVQTVSFLLLSGLLLLMEMMRQGRVRPAVFLVIATAGFALWANLHLGYMMGLAALGAFLADGVVEGIRGRGWRLAKWTAAGLVCAIAATALTPYGFGLTWHMVKVFFEPESQRYSYLTTLAITEYQPLFSARLALDPMMSYAIWWLAAMGAGMVLGLRRTRLSDWVLLSFIGWFTWWAFRYLWFLIVAVLPAVSLGWSRGLEMAREAVRGLTGRNRPKGNAGKAFFWALLTVAVSAVALLPKDGRMIWERVGLGWKARDFPWKGVERLIGLGGRDGRIFNQFGIGGFLSWHRLPVFIDGRIQPYSGTRAFQDYLRIISGNVSLLEGHAVDWVMTQYPAGRKQREFHSYLAGSGRWALVYWDDECLLYARRRNGHAGRIIAKHEYRHLNPALLDFSRPDSVMADLRRASSENPDALSPLLIMGNLMLQYGQHDQAEKAFLRAVRKDRHNALALGNLGIAYQHKGDGEKAEAYYKKALRSNPMLPEAYGNLGYLYELDKLYDKAKKQYFKCITIDNEDVWSYNRLGAIEMKLGNIPGAIRFWKEGARIDPESDAAKNLTKHR